ncbi:hypothetical protein NE237_032297 [Protea cynaroides]|uniref:Uncharacterized protein n=1 Tax=Protea cynaroides TaxID=273540 RepID=A0A9Q0R2Y7_9MAGN|nr:hypothetical protein NE237_032297 [Protea cynaroides]
MILFLSFEASFQPMWGEKSTKGSIRISASYRQILALVACTTYEPIATVSLVGPACWKPRTHKLNCDASYINYACVTRLDYIIKDHNRCQTFAASLRVIIKH